MRSERYFHPEFGWLAPTSPAANDLPPHGLVPPYRRKALDGIVERRIPYPRPNYANPLLTYAQKPRTETEEKACSSERAKEAVR